MHFDGNVLHSTSSSGIIRTGVTNINYSIVHSHPADVAFGSKELNQRQNGILDKLPEYGSQEIFKKHEVSMLDLSAMTAKTGDEFAMFTRKGERLIVRGNKDNVPISTYDAIMLRNEGYHWSGHKHPGIGDASLIASDGDRRVLEAFRQGKSALYNSAGRYSFIE